MSKHFGIYNLLCVGILIYQEISSVWKILFHILINSNKKNNQTTKQKNQTCLVMLYRNAKKTQ